MDREFQPVKVIHPNGAEHTCDSEAMLESFLEDGWDIVDEAEVQTDIAKMNKAELVQFAIDNGFDVSDKMTKDEIIAVITSETDGEDDDSGNGDE